MSERFNQLLYFHSMKYQSGIKNQLLYFHSMKHQSGIKKEQSIDTNKLDESQENYAEWKSRKAAKVAFCMIQCIKHS